MPFFPSLPFLLMVSLLCVLFVAGGSSRADAPGQVIVQGASVLVIIAILLRGTARPFADAKPVFLILLAIFVLGVIQLIPLPPALWQDLPGREPFLRAAEVVGEPQPWRPISLVPGATVNAVASLFVPFATLLLISQLKEAEQQMLPGLILGVIAATMFVGLIQFSGARVTTALADNGAGDVSGFVANRNHFALVLAIGCVIAPTWAFLGKRIKPWRGQFALGLVLLFTLTILACGSRAGIIVGAGGSIIGLAICRQAIRRMLDRYPRWLFPVVLSTILLTIAAFVLASFTADRAISVNRLLAMDAAQDMRGRALPTILTMVKTYFPIGSGLGSFDPVFRMHEPLDLLTTTYFNHAHNDFLEIALDGGLAGLVLLCCAILWWLKQTRIAWSKGSDMRHALPKAGSATILLTVIASISDYPARTPLVMAILVIAASWLTAANASRSSALPPSGRLL